MFQKKKKKKGFWGVLETFFNIKKGLKSGLIRDSGKNGDSFTWWDRFRFGCKT
ncbi:hypothetical protein [Helicobacter pylori]|uniref:hypothetical protein n=1 Tax=Helicobacter pylori TaxID=210 RepID=UPI0012B2776B|nr:hypothetical protein [Helicobacter pylori]